MSVQGKEAGSRSVVNDWLVIADCACQACNKVQEDLLLATCWTLSRDSTVVPFWLLRCCGEGPDKHIQF